MNKSSDLRPENSVLTNSLYGNSDTGDSKLERPEAITSSSISSLFFKKAQELGNSRFCLVHNLETGADEETSWREIRKEVILIAEFLKNKLSVKKGDKVAILSHTRKEWAVADLAILSLGAVSTPIYHSLTDSEAGYVLWNSGAEVVFVENQEQLEKIVSVNTEKFEIPKSEAFEGGNLTLDTKAVISFEDAESKTLESKLYSFKDITSFKFTSSDELESATAKEIISISDEIDKDDLASIVYTSGTTGLPKGVMQSHNNHLSILNDLLESGVVADGKKIFLFLPLAHSFARFIFYGALARGGDLIFPSIVDREKTEFSAKQLFVDIKNSKPKVLPSVPRIFEKVMTAVTGKTNSMGRIKKPLVEWAIANYRPLKNRLSEEGVSGAFLKLKYIIAENVVNKIKTSVFGSDLIYCISGGAPLAKEVSVFFNSLDILILEGYGLTETTPVISCNTKEKNIFGTVGRRFKSVEIKVAEDGELLTKGPNLSLGYYKLPEATNKAWSEEGWFHTGDIVQIDALGYIRITDRKKDLIVNAGGKNIPPQKIEGKIKTISCISQVLVYGDKKPYLVGLFTLDMENIQSWAKANIPGKDHSLEALADNPKVREMIDKELERINEDLASYEEVKRYRILPEDFTIENGLLSPTLKLKRRVATKRYKDVIEEIYSWES